MRLSKNYLSQNQKHNAGAGYLELFYKRVNEIAQWVKYVTLYLFIYWSLINIFEIDELFNNIFEIDELFNNKLTDKPTN